MKVNRVVSGLLSKKICAHLFEHKEEKDTLNKVKCSHYYSVNVIVCQKTVCIVNV